MAEDQTGTLFLTSTSVKPSHRVFAKFVDLFLVMLVAAALPYPIGPLLGFIYSLFADGMPFKKFKGQSLGKKIFKIRVVKTNREKTPSWMSSLQRNAPVGVATFFALIPIWGWAILLLIGIPMMVVEVYLLVRAPRGQRLGDVMADTEVIHETQ